MDRFSNGQYFFIIPVFLVGFTILAIFVYFRRISVTYKKKADANLAFLMEFNGQTAAHRASIRNMDEGDFDDTLSFNWLFCCFADKKLLDGPSIEAPLISSAEALERVSMKKKDVERWFLRLYFQGNNLPEDPLRLSVPVGRTASLLKDTIHFDNFADHAREVNKILAWQPRDATLRNVLTFLYPVFGFFFMRYKRTSKLEALRTFHAHQGHSFILDHKGRALGNVVRLGESVDGGLVWLDFLSAHVVEPGVIRSKKSRTYSRLSDSAMEPEEPKLRGDGPLPRTLNGVPTLPVVITCTGNGTCLYPFYIDLRDPLVQSLGPYFGQNWFAFISALNCRLRVIRFYNRVLQPAAFAETLSYLSTMNRMSIGIGRLTPLCGITVNLGCQVTAGDALTEEANTISNVVGSQLLPATVVSSDSFRLVLIVQNATSGNEKKADLKPSSRNAENSHILQKQSGSIRSSVASSSDRQQDFSFGRSGSSTDIGAYHSASHVIKPINANKDTLDSGASHVLDDYIILDDVAVLEAKTPDISRIAAHPVLEVFGRFFLSSRPVGSRRAVTALTCFVLFIQFFSLALMFVLISTLGARSNTETRGFFYLFESVPVGCRVPALFRRCRIGHNESATVHFVRGVRQHVLAQLCHLVNYGASELQQQ